MSVRERVRGFIEELIEAELEEALSRPRYGRSASSGAANAGVARLADTGMATGRAR